MTEQAKNGSGVTPPQANISAPKSGEPSGALRVESKATENQSDDNNKDEKVKSKIEDLLKKNGIDTKSLSQKSKSTFEKIIKKIY